MLGHGALRGLRARALPAATPILPLLGSVLVERSFGVAIESGVSGSFHRPLAGIDGGLALVEAEAGRRRVLDFRLLGVVQVLDSVEMTRRRDGAAAAAVAAAAAAVVGLERVALVRGLNGSTVFDATLWAAWNILLGFDFLALRQRHTRLSGESMYRR